MAAMIQIIVPTNENITPRCTLSIFKVTVALSVTPIQKEIKGLELPSELNQLNSWKNLGHRQPLQGQNEMPDHLLIVHLLESAQEQSIDTSQTTRRE